MEAVLYRGIVRAHAGGAAFPCCRQNVVERARAVLLPAAEVKNSIVIACGGTGGHIFPGLAVGEALRRRGVPTTVVLGARAVERHCARGWAGDSLFVPGEARGSGLRGMLLRAIDAWRAAECCTRSFRVQRHAALLAMGGYSSVGPVLAARRCGIPIALHESNAVLGRAVRVLAPLSRRVAVGFAATAASVRHARVTVTGFPLRAAVVEAARARRARDGVPAAATPLALVLGGSQGARALNTRAPAGLAALARRVGPLGVVHVCGPGQEDAVRARYASEGLEADVAGFRDDVASLLDRAHVAISRAGSSACAELRAVGVPTVLVPYPHAQDDHQRANARLCAAEGWARILEEGDATPEALADALAAWLDGARPRVRPAADTVLDAADRLADLILDLAGEPP